MPVLVSFVTPKGIGSVDAPGIGSCRVSEVVALDSVSSNAAEDGEIVLLGSSETNIVRGAHGKTPDAAASAKTEGTSAGYPVTPGQVTVVVPNTGEKISVKALA